MQTYLVERATPPTFRFNDRAELARHARLAADAYRQVTAFWLGGVVTDQGMFSLVTAEQADDLHAYGRLIGVGEGEMTLRRVLQPLGPFYAEALR